MPERKDDSGTSAADLQVTNSLANQAIGGVYPIILKSPRGATSPVLRKGVEALRKWLKVEGVVSPRGNSDIEG